VLSYIKVFRVTFSRTVIMKTPQSKNSYLIQGFTLIELMIAVAIIAILAGIAIPAYNGYITSARITECANEVTAISLAQKQFFLENNRYFPSPNATATSKAAANYYIPIENASGGYFRSTYREHGLPVSAANPKLVAHVQCDYTITSPDPTGAGGAISYQLLVAPTPGKNLVNQAAEVAALSRIVN